MNQSHRLTLAFLAAGMLVAPTAAQPTNAQADARTQAQAQPPGLQVAMQQMSSVQERLNGVMDMVESKREQAERSEAKMERSIEARAESGSRKSAGAEVSHSVETENGTKTISHKVEKDGKTLVSFVKEIFVGEEKENETEEQDQEDKEESNTSSEARAEAGMEARRGGTGEAADVEVETETKSEMETEEENEERENSSETESEAKVGAEVN